MLPDGTECVVGVCGRAGNSFLYNVQAWREGISVLKMPISYEVCGRGTVTTGRGRHTGWDVTNLVDTNVTLESAEEPPRAADAASRLLPAATSSLN